MSRRGFSNWSGDHARWSEPATYSEKSTLRPRLIKRRDDLDWLMPVREGAAPDLLTAIITAKAKK